MLTIAIQAGGKSTRMGQEKGLIKLAGRPLIEHVISKVRGLGDELLITTNNPKQYAFLGFRMVSDRIAGAGALEGLRTALGAAHGETVLVLACDMPFLNRALLEHLILQAPRADVVMPRVGNFYEPLHAVYSRACLSAIDVTLLNGERKLTSFLTRVGVYYVGEDELDRFDPEGLSFYNINTAEDLARAEELIRNNT